MPSYKKISEKASETVTFRLRIDEKRLLDYMASVENMSLADLMRSMLVRRAGELNIAELPPVTPKRKPGRPRRKTIIKPETMMLRPDLGQLPPMTPLTPITPTITMAHTAPKATKNEIAASTFSDLLNIFTESFAGRAEGTRKELDDMVDFLKYGLNGSPLIPMEIPVASLTSDHLNQAREKMKTMDIRLSKKNLHLTYLRMMLHFAIKQPQIIIHVNPAINLKPLTLKELASHRNNPGLLQ